MIRGRIIFVFLLVCGLMALRSLAAQQKDASRAGWISDEACWCQTYKAWRCGLASRNVGAEALRWDIRNGNPSEPSL
jgi:hypothetical protein